MRITRDMLIAGLPAMEARQQVRDLTANNNNPVVYAEFATPDELAVLDRFVDAGLFERTTTGQGVAYELTTHGAALAMATANPPVKRATAERALAGLLDRARAANGDPDLLMWVDRIAVFGSYLDPDVERLGDVDCGVWLSRRETDGDKWVKASLERARRTGRNLLFIQQLSFGETEVQRLLKGRSPVLSLHYAGLDPVLDQVELRTVYAREPSS